MYANDRSLGRFTSPALLILFCLRSSGAKHGNAIVTMLAEQSDIVLEPGTLYAALARLEQRGWILPLQNESPRRSYRLTDAGYAVLDSSLFHLHEKLIYHMLAEHPHL
jgi:DNA-binding PadR family transcriptional regulator